MTNEERSPAEIERDIERERAGLVDTLDDLQDKFSVETIARQFTDQFREHGSDIGKSVSDAVKRNPVALALTGVGLAWLMMGGKSDDRIRHDRDRRYGRSAHDRRHDGREGHAGPSGVSYARAPQPQGRRLGQQPGDSAYKPDDYRQPRDIPSWARSQDTDQHGVGSKVGGAMSGAGERVSGAASAAADTARGAGSTVTSKAKGAAEAVSDAGKSLADNAQDVASSASDCAAALRARLAEGTEDLTEEARARVIAAREKAVEARNAAASHLRHGRERAVDIFEEQPLIAGALAVALGAALGAALPRSRVEDEYLGEHSDQLIEEAERIFEEEKQKLGKVAKAATDEAKKIADETKANADEAAPADTAAKAVMDKAKSSGQRIADAAETEAKRQNLGDVTKS